MYKRGKLSDFFFSVWDCVGFFVCVKEEIKEDINAEAFALKEQMCVSAIYWNKEEVDLRQK